MATSINTIINIPDCYEELADILKEKISNYGVDLIKDCTASSINYNKNLVSCWNMFQSACIAFNNGLIKQATLLVNYIIKTLNLNISIDKDKEPEIDKNTFIITINGRASINNKKEITYHKSSGDERYDYINLSELLPDKNYRITNISIESGNAIIIKGVLLKLCNINSDVVLKVETIRYKEIPIISINTDTEEVTSDIISLGENNSIKLYKIQHSINDINLINEDGSYFEPIGGYALAEINYENISIIDKNNNISTDEFIINENEINVRKILDIDYDIKFIKINNIKVLTVNKIAEEYNLLEAPTSLSDVAWVTFDDTIYVAVYRNNSLIWKKFATYE